MALVVENDRQGAGHACQFAQFTPEELELLNSPNPTGTKTMQSVRQQLVKEMCRRNPQLRDAFEVLDSAHQHPHEHHMAMELGRATLVLVADNGKPLNQEALMPQLRHLMRGYSQLVVTRRRIPLTGIVAATKLVQARINDVATPLVAAVVNPVLEGHEVSPHSIELQSNAIGEVLSNVSLMGVGSLYVTN